MTGSGCWRHSALSPKHVRHPNWDHHGAHSAFIIVSWSRSQSSICSALVGGQKPYGWSFDPNSSAFAHDLRPLWQEEPYNRPPPPPISCPNPRVWEDDTTPWLCHITRQKGSWQMSLRLLTVDSEFIKKDLTWVGLIEPHEPWEQRVLSS